MPYDRHITRAVALAALGSLMDGSFVLHLEGGTRARSATGRLTKIVGHHELRLRGLARRTNGGTGVRQGLIFLSADFAIYPIQPHRRQRGDLPPCYSEPLCVAALAIAALVARRRHHFGSERSRIALQTPYESREVGDELNHVSPGVRYCTRCKPIRVAAGLYTSGRAISHASPWSRQSK